MIMGDQQRAICQSLATNSVEQPQMCIADFLTEVRQFDEKGIASIRHQDIIWFYIRIYVLS